MSSGFDNLTVLDLSSNNFTGGVPESYVRLVSLEVLSLSGNLLNGTFPQYVTSLTKLTQLLLAYNPLTPSSLPEDIDKLTKLENLFVCSSNLVGEIPESIGNLESLSNLDLSQNQLSGRIPETLSGLKSIEQIELYGNMLEGELPESLSNLTTLLRLDVSENNLTGMLPEKIAAMGLQGLNVNDNHLSGEIPEVLGLNPNLIHLNLFNNSFTGNLPANLGKFSDLEDIDVSTNLFSGEFPYFLCYRRKLQRIVAFNNRFSGSLPDSYNECSSLNYIRIGNNELSGAVPYNFWGNKELTFLELSNNRFEGSIAPSISGAQNMTMLLISGNNFSGQLPSEICELSELIEIRISQNQFTGELPSCITKLNRLQKLEAQENILNGVIPCSVNSWPDLTVLDLSKNRLSGRIPPELGELPVLMFLSLEENSLSGEIPVELAQSKLQKFNLSHNNFYGKIPSGFANALYVSSLLGNPKLCSPNLPPFPHCSKKQPRFGWIIAVLAIAAMLLVASQIWFFKTKSVFFKRSNHPHKVITFQWVGFSEEDIFPHLTKENLIGSGGSGQVYKVSLKTHPTVAVKKLFGGGNKSEAESAFRSEIEILGRIRHTNILKLLMCCSSEEFMILVYDYMENGSLSQVLHEQENCALSDWSKRLDIAVGVAHALAYLHHDCVPSILHRDVKSNNILLDDEMKPRVADFGLAKALRRQPGETDDAVSRVAGSYGYISPEYAYTLRISEKSDVYSFGVVLMELVTGKRPIDPSFGEDKDIVKWVTEAALLSSWNGQLSGFNDLKQIIDPRMDQSTCDYEEIERVLNVALLCTRAFPMNRPSMKRVVELLKDQKLAP